MSPAVGQTWRSTGDPPRVYTLLRKVGDGFAYCQPGVKDTYTDDDGVTSPWEHNGECCYLMPAWFESGCVLASEGS